MDKRNKNAQNRLKRNAYNFLYNRCRSPAGLAQWTIYKPQEKSEHKRNPEPTLLGKYATSFVPCNARATNEHIDRKHLAYLINRFEHPVIWRWFDKQGIKLNQEAIALSELLQWIWRSAIRDGKPITLYIPSKRMRTLLTDFLNTGVYGEHTIDPDNLQVKAA